MNSVAFAEPLLQGEKMSATIYHFDEIKEKNFIHKENKSHKEVNVMNQKNLTENEFYDIVNNAVASLLMSLEEDGIDSEHPLITYKMVPEIGVVVEKYLRKIINLEQ